MTYNGQWDWSLTFNKPLSVFTVFVPAVKFTELVVYVVVNRLFSFWVNKVTVLVDHKKRQLCYTVSVVFV